jgi:hypothetical protein
MPGKNFEVSGYEIVQGTEMTLGGGAVKFYAYIACHGAGGERFGLYFLRPDSPPCSNECDLAANWAASFLPANQFQWYVDLLRNEASVCAHVDSDTPSANRLYTGPKPFNDEKNFADLDAWLTAHPDIAKTIIWEAPGGTTRAYPEWPAEQKAELIAAFQAAWKGDALPLTDPPSNMLNAVKTIIPEAQARPLYLAHAGHSLAVEIARTVSWSLLEYAQDNLKLLFDSRGMFLWRDAEAGYEVSYAVPAPPSIEFAFMRFKGLIALTRRATIARLLDWCRSHLYHFRYVIDGDVQDMEAQWQYRGWPPVSRILSGTSVTGRPEWGFHHWTAGCYGTTFFLRALLRAVNIPVVNVSVGGHTAPHFTSEGLYLSHGDDPYDLLSVGIPPIPADELFIDQVKFDLWFGGGKSVDEQEKYVAARPRELAIQYLSLGLLQTRCDDIKNSRSRETSKVFEIYKDIYSLADLEAASLWERIDARIADLGGCEQISGYNPFDKT